MKTQLPFYVAFGLVGLGQALHAQTYPLEVNVSNRGWVDSTGFGDRSNGNYIAGQINGTEYRNYFNFSLDDVSGEVVSAQLTLRVPDSNSFVTDGTSENIVFTGVGSSPNYGQGGTINSVSTFNSLGDGIVYGAGAYDATTQEFTVDLNFDFIDAINESSSDITLGGSLASISGPADQYVFGNTNWSLGDAIPAATLKLEIVDRSGTGGSTVPEPSSALLGGLSALFLAGRRRR